LDFRRFWDRSSFEYHGTHELGQEDEKAGINIQAIKK